MKFFDFSLWQLCQAWFFILSSDFVFIEIFEILIAFINAFKEPDLSGLFIVSNDFGSVLKDHFYKSFSHRGRVLHAWRHVNLDEPRVVILVYHKIIPDKLNVALSAIKEAFARLDGPHYYVPHLLLNLLPLVISEELNQLGLSPHALVEY